MNETLLMVFIGVSSLAIVIQACILVAMYVTTKKTSAQIEKLAAEIRSKALPAVESVQKMIVDNKGRIEEIIENITSASSTARAQLARIDSTLNDVLDRTRLQVIRADELLNRTMDRVEATSDAVHKTVISPLRQVNGLMSAISTGDEVFIGQKRRHPKNGAGVPQDEMFI